MNKERNICIVGLGLLGGSYAMGLTDAGYTVTAVDVRPEAIRYALEKGIIAAGAVEDFAPLLAGADAVVLGLYPHALVDWLRNNQKHLKPGALLTDVCGIKSGVVEEIQGFLRPDAEFIASHPMAGKEVSGVEHADCAIFKPANFIIVPEYTGDSFRDLTRIAKINENLWSELFFLNKENLIAEIDQFSASLEGLKRALVENDETELKRLFVQSTARRRLFDKKREAR